MLADPFRLEGEGEVAWQRPGASDLARAGLGTITGGLDDRRVHRLAGELDRGLQRARPEFLKWICDKLSALPTQNGTGLNAALWADNVIDVCGHFPEDLLQTACLELLRTKTFRPSPAEIVTVIEPRFTERQRMLGRAKSLMAPKAEAADKPFVKEPLEVRVRGMRDSFRRVGHVAKAAKYEHELAGLEGRAPEDWACEVSEPSGMGEKVNTPKLPPLSDGMQARLNLALARQWHKQGDVARAEALRDEARRLYGEAQRPPNSEPIDDFGEGAAA